MEAGGRGDVGRADRVRMDTVSVIECMFGQAGSAHAVGVPEWELPRERSRRFSLAQHFHSTFF